MGKYFGTDGIRGQSNKFPMTPDIALKVGKAAGTYFKNGNHRHRVVIGKDTRLSGYMLEPALTAGFVSVGMDVFLVGPMPTPAVSMLTRSLRADLGVMLSASHNQYFDNGIKLFNKDGIKLSDKIESEIESIMEDESLVNIAKPDHLGRAKRLDDAPGRYIEFIKNIFPKNNFSGLKIVLDCANGAAYKLGPIILWELGAEVITIGNSPNGFNINKECGSTHPENLCTEVVKNGADIGISLDGDADRLVICDEFGTIIDGDQIIAAIAKYQKDNSLLKGDSVVTTIMSNMGLEKYLNSIDLNMVRANVGDRYVAEAMRDGGYNLGGEQSGHIILNDHSTTGDGLLAAIQLLVIMSETKKNASELFNIFKPFPQKLVNIKFTDNDPLDLDPVKEKIEELSKIDGRVLIRKSGTEPLIRVMVEGEDSKVVDKTLCELVNFISKYV